ncbi:MAG TPA: hypothetical protein ENK18_17355 [Deltaproteobacteria bacterium]|nr:hypothetical protein [Deltaproteobacteria bacterium]
MILLLLPSTLGCASILPQYEAAMERALVAPPPTPTQWIPDAVLHLSGESINTIIQTAIEDYGTFSSTVDLKIASVTPDLALTSMEISAGNDCGDCLGIAMELDGTLSWETVLGSGSTSLAATGSLDARFEVSRDDQEDWIVSVQPQRFRWLDVTLGQVTAGVSGIGEKVQDWIDRNLVAQVPPQQIMVIASEDLPLAALEIVPSEDGVELQLLTLSAERGHVEVGGDHLESGWHMDLSPESLISLARAEAFRAEPMARGIVAEPTLLRMDSDTFQMGLRLWRIEGRGWWRDYLIDGTITVVEDEIRLAATSVEQVDKSAGAAAADPLAALAKGLILKYIEDAFETSIPAIQGEDTQVVITSIDANEDGSIRVSGTIQAAAAAAAAAAPKSRGRSRAAPAPADTYGPNR